MSAVDSEMQDFEAELRLSSNDDAEEEQGEIERELTSGDDDENEDGDNEPAVDLRGYKHCNIYNPYYFGYTTPYDSDILVQTFEMPGRVAANMLRAYLRDNLHPQLVFNEYGEQCDIMDISNSHLAILQAKLWSGRPATASALTAPACLSSAEKPILDHVLKIRDVLNEEYIFVVDYSVNATCACAGDLHVPTLSPDDASAMVRLEPLMHWGTVGTTLDSYPILCFRRDGVLMKHPEYKGPVDRLVELDTPTYCVDCLLLLWDKRDEAFATLRQRRGGLSARDGLRARGQAARNLLALPQYDGASDQARSSGPIERAWSHTLQPRKPLEAEREPQEDPLALKPKIAVLLTALRREKDMSDEEFAALGFSVFMQSHKTVRDRICICHEPANCYATKQEPSEVVKCTEADCLFTWYHLDCLDSPDRERAREGTLVCETCREGEGEEEGGL